MVSCSAKQEDACILIQVLLLWSVVFLEFYTPMALKGLLLILATLLSLHSVVSSNCPTSPFTGSNGTIRSPGFNTPQSYGDNLACTYNILVPANRRVMLEFKKLDVLGTMPDCAEDSLEIYVG